MRVQYASGRKQLCQLDVESNIASGSTLSSGTYYFWLVGRNDVGYNTPSEVAVVTLTTSNTHSIELTIPSVAFIPGENWKQLLILINTSNNPSTAKVLYIFETDELVLPYSLTLLKSAHITPSRNVTVLPSGSEVLSGEVVTLNSDGNIYFKTLSGSNWKRHFESYFVGLVTDTEDSILGCDTPLSLLNSSRHVINYDYSLDGSKGEARKYWIYNDTTVPLFKGRQLGLIISIEDADVSTVFYGLLQVVFEGYFDSIEEEYVLLKDSVSGFSYLDVEIPYSSNLENLQLEKELLPGQAFQFKVFPEFDLSDLGLDTQTLPMDGNITLIPYLVPVTAKESDLGDLLGSVILGTDSNLRRVYPTTGLSAWVDTGVSIVDGKIAKAVNPSVVFNLQPNSSQLLAINSIGNVYPVESVRPYEKLRCKVETLPGISRVSQAFTFEAPIDSDPTIEFNLTYPTKIRDNYPDVIKSSTKGFFNAEEILVFVEREILVDTTPTRQVTVFSGITPTNSTQDSIVLNWSNGVSYLYPLASTTQPSEFKETQDFSLYSGIDCNVTDIEVSTSGTLHTYSLRVAFKYNGGSISNITHQVSEGCIPEMIETLSQMIQMVKEIEEGFNEISIEFEDIKVDFEEVQSEVDSLATIATTASTTVGTFDTRLTQAETVATQAQTAAAGAVSTANSYSGAISTLNTQISDLQTSASQQSSQIQNLDARVDTLEAGGGSGGGGGGGSGGGGMSILAEVAVPVDESVWGDSLLQVPENLVVNFGLYLVREIPIDTNENPEAFTYPQNQIYIFKSESISSWEYLPPTNQLTFIPYTDSFGSKIGYFSRLNHFNPPEVDTSGYSKLKAIAGSFSHHFMSNGPLGALENCPATDLVHEGLYIVKNQPLFSNGNITSNDGLPELYYFNQGTLWSEVASQPGGYTNKNKIKASNSTFGYEQGVFFRVGVI